MLILWYFYTYSLVPNRRGGGGWNGRGAWKNHQNLITEEAGINGGKGERYLEILGNMYITIVCLPSCDVIKFEINLVFFIKPFCYMTKKSKQKLKYLENEKSF